MPDPFRPRRPRRPSPPRERTDGRRDAPGDPRLETPPLASGVPFRFDAAFAARLRRREVNVSEAFTVLDADGAWWRASLKALDPAGGEALPYERMTASPEPSVELTLACAVPARQRMLLVVQKAVELGAARVVPLVTERSVRPGDFAHEKAHAWPGQVLRAVKQCRRSSLPELAPAASLEAFLSSPAASADLALYLDDAAGAAAPPAGSPRRIVLIVGPEGGFTDAERGLLSARARPWRLGGRVLRAETAALAALAAAQAAWGDFR